MNEMYGNYLFPREYFMERTLLIIIVLSLHSIREIGGLCKLSQTGSFMLS